jgi:hypothetical protein
MISGEIDKNLSKPDNKDANFRPKSTMNSRKMLSNEKTEIGYKSLSDEHVNSPILDTTTLFQPLEGIPNIFIAPRGTFDRFGPNMVNLTTRDDEMNENQSEERKNAAHSALHGGDEFCTQSLVFKETFLVDALGSAEELRHKDKKHAKDDFSSGGFLVLLRLGFVIKDLGETNKENARDNNSDGENLVRLETSFEEDATEDAAEDDACGLGDNDEDSGNGFGA